MRKYDGCAETRRTPRTRIRRCLAFLFSAVLFISSAFSATLPSGYTQLEYIESTGAQYIDTELTNIGIPDILATVSFGDFSRYNFVLGGRTGWQEQVSDKLAILNTINDGNGTPSIGYSYGDVSQSLTRYNQYTDLQKDFKYKIHLVGDVNSISFYVNNTLISSYLGTKTDTPGLYLFDVYTEGQVSPSSSALKGKMYSCKIKNNDVLVRDLIPAKRNSDGMVGMYDTVNDVFYTNSGTGSFIAGPRVCGDGYKVLEYLKSSGTQYIEDSSFTTIATGVIETKIKDLEKNCRFAGWGNDYYMYTAIALATPNSLTNYFPFNYANSWDDNNPNPVNIANENEIRFEFKPGLQKLYVNNAFNRQSQKTGTLTSYPFRMFKVSLNGDVRFTGSSTIYYVKVYDGDNKLLRNYIPVQRDDGVLGMYDTVYGNFYTNAGTGTFTAGSVLTDKCLSDYAETSFTCDGNNTEANMLGAQVCLSESQPTGLYLTARYSGNKYYINLSEEIPNSPKTVTSESENILRIITNSGTYNVHDASVWQ